MKLINVLLLLTVLSFKSFGQTSEDQLLKVYSSSELEDLKNTSPENYNLLIYALSNGLTISDFPSEKKEKFVNEINLPESAYNFTDLGLRIIEKNQYFKIVGTNKVLTVKSFYTLNYEKNGN